MKKKHFHGEKKKHSYFEGWYLKHQIMGKTIAFIPAVHGDEKGQWSASLQVAVSDGVNDGSWYFTWPMESCEIAKDRFWVKIGANIFSEKGISVNIKTETLTIEGKIAYSNFRKIKGNIMGFFQLLPFMQCNHSVLSMTHRLKGSLTVNDEVIEFTGGNGYVEKDWGQSFPKDYLWTQCGFGMKGKNSIMAAAAHIPIMGTSFRGCICAVHYEGKEYRMGTYYGAKILQYEDGGMVLRQGNKVLRIKRLGERALNLRAPSMGAMERTIKESPICKVQYQFYRGKEQVFNLISERASFEQVI
ncbi:MAG: tocopherol cyclase family protein [Muricomes sp.]